MTSESSKKLELMEENSYSFGEYIRARRLEKGLSLTDAAELMGMKVQKLCDIESGRRYHTRTSLDLVQKASKAFGIPIAQIVASVQTTMKVTQSTAEVLTELAPTVRMVELISDKLAHMSKTYPPEFEELTTELCSHIKNIKMLTKLLQNRKYMGDRILGG
jgi:transcriptional regulator with XRE-family HTH domain